MTTDTIVDWARGLGVRFAVSFINKERKEAEIWDGADLRKYFETFRKTYAGQRLYEIAHHAAVECIVRRADPFIVIVNFEPWPVTSEVVQSRKKVKTREKT